MSEFCFGNCDKCPNVKAALEKAEDIENFSKTAAEAAMDPRVDEEVAPEIFDSIPDYAKLATLMPDGEVRSIDSSEELASALRQAVSLATEHIDNGAESLRQEAMEITDGCSGPLKMRAEKAGKIVTVTVCMGPQAPEGSVTEHVDVNRRDA